MSLISQNGLPKNKIEKKKRKASIQALVSEGEPKIEDGEKNDSDAQEMEKRKKARKGRNKNFKKLQEKSESLANSIFGSVYSPVRFRKDKEELGNLINENSDWFFTDKSAEPDMDLRESSDEEEDEENKDEENKDEEEGEGEGEETEDEEEEEGEDREKKPVWVDEEEEKTEINIAKINRLRKLRKEDDESVISGSTYVSRLRAQHAKMNPGTEWAQLNSQSKIYSSDEEDSDAENGVIMARGYKNKEIEDVDNILRSNEDLVVKSSVKLLPGLLEYSRLVDANSEDPSKAPINSVQFHRNAQLLLTGGLDKKLRFFQIDGKRNTKIQSIFLDDCPIRKAAFLPDGSQVIAAGRRKFFYTLDLVKSKVDKIGPLTGREEKSLEFFEVSPDSNTIAFVGNEGYILLVSTKTKQLIGTLKMNGTARSLAFANNGQHLLSSGGDGQIYHWDLRKMACFHKVVDEGCINGTAICTSPNGNLFAAGSDSGIVNIYNREEFLGGKRKPIKTIENLTTKVDFMKFNNDAQILAISSNMKNSSLKLVHIPSFTVFSNWPPPNRSLQYPRCLDFSPGGGFMAMGNAAGKVLLYKLHHYEHA